MKSPRCCIVVTSGQPHPRSLLVLIPSFHRDAASRAKISLAGVWGSPWCVSVRQLILPPGRWGRPPCNTLRRDTLCSQDTLALAAFASIPSVNRGAAKLLTRPTSRKIRRSWKRRGERAVNFASGIAAQVWANQEI
jgi:hypothetical protein